MYRVPLANVLSGDCWNGHRFVSKLQTPPIGETIHRSLAITYIYQKVGIWPLRSFIRGDSSLLYMSFIVRTPSIEVSVSLYHHRSPLADQADTVKPGSYPRSSSASDLGMGVPSSNLRQEMAVMLLLKV